MPVVVTDATDPIGEAVVRLLAGRAEVRAFASGELAASLRGAGAKVTERTLDDPDAIRSALNDAHTIIHTADGLFGPEDAIEETNLGSTERLLAASNRAGIRRFLLVSSVGADPASPNRYLATKGRAEELVRDADLEHAIVRVTVVREHLPRMVRRRLAWTHIPGTGAQRFAPVWAEEVASVLVAADDRAGAVEGTFALGGPDRAPLRELARSSGRWLRGALPGSRAARRLPLSGPAVEVLSADRLPDAPDARAAFGVGPGR